LKNRRLVASYRPIHSYRQIWQLTECLYLAVISARHACVARASDVVFRILEAFRILTWFEISKSGKGFGVETVDAESTDHAAPARVHCWISLISSSFDNDLNFGVLVDLKIIGWAQRRSS
jgi:hypothetical protein